MGTALASTLATSAIAGDCSFSGFYLGAQLGAGTTNTEVKFAQPRIAATANRVEQTKQNVKNNLGATGAIGGLHVGYGKHFPNRFYLGLEAYGNLSGNKATYTHSTATRSASFKSERNNAFGIALRPGIVFGNALFYAKLGVESADFKYSVSESITGPGGSKLSGSKNTRRTGFVPGIGVAFNVTDHVILGVEATHTFYNSTSVNNVGRRTAIPANAKAGSLTNSTKFQSQATDVFARVSYKW